MRETVYWRGIPFHRDPESEKRSERVYFTANRLRLHQALWADENGPIPPGFHIHHVDGDATNNDPENLEALPAAEHMALHPRTDYDLEHLERIRSQAAAWHSTPEGIAWHREHGRKTWESREPVERTCDQCGGKYVTRKAAGARFCSNACKAAWRRATGIDDEDRECAICGSSFSVNKYSSARACSRKCAGRLQSRTKRGLQPDRRRDA